MSQKLSRLLLPALLAGGLAGTAAADDTDIAINEVFYLGNAATDWVELKNTGNQTLDVSTWWLCARFEYAQLEDLPLLDGVDLLLAPGEIVTVGIEMDLDNGSSDLGLYTTNEFPNPAAMVDFLQWGTDMAVGRTLEAVTRGLWRELARDVYDSVPVADPGQSTSYCGSNSGGGILTFSKDFFSAEQTRGAENPDCIFADGFESGDTTAWSTTVGL